MQRKFARERWYLERQAGGRPEAAGGGARAPGAAASPVAGRSVLGLLGQPAQLSTALLPPCPAALWLGCEGLLCHHPPVGTNRKQKKSDTLLGVMMRACAPRSSSPRVHMQKCIPHTACAVASLGRMQLLELRL